MILDALVVGGGQAGLAAAYHLQRQGLSFKVLDALPRTGDSWRRRWEGLRLFSPQRYNALPGLPPSGGPWHLPTRLELADYLETYARTFALPVAHNEEVRAVARGDHFTVTTARGNTYRSAQLIVATGAYQTPFIPPALAANFPAVIPQYHSTEVRAVNELVDSTTSVLVIGAGASGQQLSKLALDAGAQVVLAGPRVSNLPRRLLGKDIYWWLYRAGLMSVRTDLPPASLFPAATGGVVTVDEHEAELLSHPALQRETCHVSAYQNGQLGFTTRKKLTSWRQWPGDRRGVIIWCTGFRNAYPWLPAPATDERGVPRQQGGKSTVIPGLYFLGLENLRHPNSSLVGGVGRDAAKIVGRLKDARDNGTL